MLRERVSVIVGILNEERDGWVGGCHRQAGGAAAWRRVVRASSTLPSCYNNKLNTLGNGPLHLLMPVFNLIQSPKRYTCGAMDINGKRL